MSHQAGHGLETLISLEDMEGLFFLWRGNARAPLRRLLPFTIFVAVIIGLAAGVAVGVPSGLLGYYLLKEALNGLIAGFFAPLFLWLGRRGYARWRRQQGEPRPVGNLMYSLAGFLAGCMTIPTQFVLPPIIPLGFWLILYPLATAALFPLIAAMVDYVQLQKDENTQTKELFGRYVSEGVARRILEERNHVTLTGEKRHCTVLFSDIRGFTRMLKELGPEEVVHTLNEYFSQMIDCIFQFDGMVNKFIGDGIIVLYGAPVTLGNDALRAVQTARQMHITLKKINREREAIGKPPIHIGIGIDSGDVVVGNIGSARRLEYTAIGSAVNNAYFLGGIAPPDVVYITENVYRELAGQVPVKPWQRVQLKSGTGEVMVYTFETTVD